MLTENADGQVCLFDPDTWFGKTSPEPLAQMGGADFKKVLEETIRIAEPGAPDISLPTKGKWPLADAYYGDGWSVAYRVLDAQFWGVPQRRRRIVLVADFGGLSAPEILFVRESVSGYFETCGATRERIAGDAESGANRASGYGETGIGYWQPGIQTLRAEGENRPSRPSNIILQCGGFKPHAGARAGSIGFEEEKALTIDTGEPMAVYDARGNGNGEIVCTLTGDHQDRVTDYTALCVGNGQLNQISQISMAEQSNTLDTMHDQQAVMVAAVDCRNGTENAAINGTLQAGMSINRQNVCRQGAIVRRLTPLECERLQGYPDGWTDIGDWTDSKGKRHKAADSPRYKALGNSIALPPWKWVLKRIAAQYERDATLGSLFDGIGGFPLIWEQLNGRGSCLWASEIEEFAIAVSKRRFCE